MTHTLHFLRTAALLLLGAIVFGGAPHPARAQWSPPCIGVTPLKPIGLCPLGTSWVLTCVSGQWVWQCGR